MKHNEIEELHELATRILLICAEARIENQRSEERAAKERQRFALVHKKEGINNERKERKIKTE